MTLNELRKELLAAERSLQIAKDEFDEWQEAVNDIKHDIAKLEEPPIKIARHQEGDGQERGKRKEVTLR